LTHRAETILETVKTLLTGLTTTGIRVERARVWPVDELPALSIFKSDDLRSDEEETLDDQFTRDLTINVQAYVATVDNVETVLNAIAAEVFAAMSADNTLGLGFVFNALLIGETEPIIERTQDIPIATMTSGWLVSYQHSKTSAES